MDGDAAEPAPGELGVAVGDAGIVTGHHPQVTLRQRKADGVPVDQVQPARGAQDVARMRLAVSDHDRPALGGLAHKLIEPRQCPAQQRRMPRQQLARGFAVRTAMPRLTQLANGGLQC